MKKVLSVILAMLMLCSVFAVPSFAADTDPVVFPIDKDWWGTTFGSDYLCSDEQYIVSFDLNGGSRTIPTFGTLQRIPLFIPKVATLLESITWFREPEM